MTLRAATIALGVLIVLMCSLTPVLAAETLVDNSPVATPTGENSGAVMPDASNTASETSAQGTTPDAPIIAAATSTDLYVASANPLTATVTSQPDQSSYLSVQFLCHNKGGWQKLGILHLWLCDGNGDVVPGFSEVQVPAPTRGDSAQGAWYVPASIEFKYWYTWNPAGGKYQIKAIVDGKDGTLSSNPAYLGTYTYTRTTGFTFDVSGPLDFGSLTFGQTSATRQIALHNSGNGVIAVDAQASDWTSTTPGASSIPVSSLQASALGATWQPMTTSATSVQNAQIANGATSSTPLYWRVAIPSAGLIIAMAGQYTTTITITVRPL